MPLFDIAIAPAPHAMSAASRHAAIRWLMMPPDAMTPAAAADISFSARHAATLLFEPAALVFFADYAMPP